MDNADVAMSAYWLEFSIGIPAAMVIWIEAFVKEPVLNEQRRLMKERNQDAKQPADSLERQLN
ncbi:hypothetical protein J1614_006781 [Plenodomus biglobosus]|nr:hypothetical protein J1614_006781 [Plenodomus biglobosus]